MEEEEAATALFSWAPMVVPGLLQTRAYAQVLLRCEPGTRPEQVNALVESRLARQAILTRTDPPIFRVLLDEGVLSRPIGSTEVMREQLERLSEAIETPHIALQIVPLGASAGLNGAIAIAQSSVRRTQAVYFETAGEPVVTSNSSVVTQATMKLDAIRAEALPRTASAELIRKWLVEKWT
ncbi:DUF5753 domain-containing protein [Nonomuraea sp. NPDC059007]|uniref:DUF5753 domain-containing protein n=1 Tax=Nonomuraea sp. NPDC059007 TaxID=3346692 RepID=UPI003681DA00